MGFIPSPNVNIISQLEFELHTISLCFLKLLSLERKPISDITFGATSFFLLYYVVYFRKILVVFSFALDF